MNQAWQGENMVSKEYAAIRHNFWTSKLLENFQGLKTLIWSAEPQTTFLENGEKLLKIQIPNFWEINLRQTTSKLQQSERLYNFISL